MQPSLEGLSEVPPKSNHVTPALWVQCASLDAPILKDFHQLNRARIVTNHL